MALTVKENTKVAVEIEVTEGTYVAPSAASSFVQTLSDGFEMSPAKELLERNVFNGSIGKSKPLTGTRTVSGSMPVEMRAGVSEGGEPEYDALMRAAFGSRRQASATTADDTDGAVHSSTVVALADADANKYQVGDSVVIKRAGAYHTSPIVSVSNVAGSVSITLLIANPAGVHVNGDVVSAVNTYVPANSGHPSLSISKYVEDAVLEQATGCRVTGVSLESYTTGQLASWNFGFEGLDFDRSLTAPPFTPNYDATLPPIILEACVYQDGVQININELSFSLENTLGFATSTCAENGRTSSRVTARDVSGSFNPYKQNNSIADFTKFKNNTSFSLFARAITPTGVAGEYANVVAIYLPDCIITELAESDADGLLQETVSFVASRGADGESNEVYVSTI